jgi:hypothetical protein
MRSAPERAAGSPAFGRRSTIGCLVALAVLLGVATIGVTVLDRSLRWTATRAMQRVQSELPEDVDPARRRQLAAALDRFAGRLDACDDPNPLIGRFLALVSRFLDDHRVTPAELEALEEFLAQVENEAAQPADARSAPGAGR